MSSFSVSEMAVSSKDHPIFPRTLEYLRSLHRIFLHWKITKIPFFSGLGESSYLLYGLVRSLKPDVCVEIGSARGRSSCFIGLALKENRRGKLYAIDPHERTNWNDTDSVNTFEILRKNLKMLHLNSWVEIIRQTSDNAASNWDREIDMIFIDGDHTYEGVKRDWELFVPHVRQFGFAIFHDTTWDLYRGTESSRVDMGVPRFVEELRKQGYPVLTIDRDCGLSIVQPTKGGIALVPFDGHP
jgi:predicted O-methyltransferase YrrM